MTVDGTPIGDRWKDVVSNPGHEQGLPIRPARIDVRTFVSRDVVEFKTDSESEWIAAGGCVSLDGWR